MFGRYRGRSAMYCRVTHREQGNELFMGEIFRFCGHAVSMVRFGNPACSILLRPGK